MESLRFAFFIGAFVLLALIEGLASKRPGYVSRPKRWLVHGLISAINIGLIRVVFPWLPVGIAVWASTNHWGMLNILNLQGALSTLLTFLLLDLIIYGQHRLFHRLPLLWRFHRMHHTDTEFDVSTGIRFHPVEACLSMGVKLVVVLLLGLDPMGVLIFEITLNVASLFNHSNIRLPIRLDGWLRWVLVTPDMHRVHHSVEPKEFNRNFGFCLPWWDRLFASYKAQPDLGHLKMVIGQKSHRDEADQKLRALLIQPFKSE